MSEKETRCCKKSTLRQVRFRLIACLALRFVGEPVEAGIQLLPDLQLQGAPADPEFDQGRPRLSQQLLPTDGG